MTLLERETQLQELHAAYERARSGKGSTVLVSGEAGIGKTSLVQQFARELDSDARILWGACEALFTPRPLGPFYDVAHAIGGTLSSRVEGDSKPVDLFHSLLEAIRAHDRPSVLVLEDMHWADHATLDFVRFLARRIERVRALLVLTFRDDETGAEHPLTTTLGELSAANKVRIKLPTLSRATVESLAKQSGRDTGTIYRITGGNPFFVNEVLRADVDRVAPNVREAVLARARRLSPAARRTLDIVAVVPDRIEVDVIGHSGLTDPDALDECVARGFLHIESRHVSFRHELARLAILDALKPLQGRSINARILEALAARGARDPSTLTRLAHHAIAAVDGATIIQYVPLAAAAAGGRGAHREASTLLDTALPWAELMDSAQRARFYDQRARSCLLVARGTEAIEMGRTAVEAWHSLGDSAEEGRALVRLCEIIWAIRPPEMHTMAALGAQAIRLLEPYGESDALSLARWWHRLPESFERKDAAELNRAVANDLIERTPNAQTRISALIGLTTLEYVINGTPDLKSVEHLAREALHARDDHGLIMSFARKGWLAFRQCNLLELERHVAEGLSFARDRQLEQFISKHALDQFAAEAAMARGRWADAESSFEEISRRSTLPWFFRLPYCSIPIAVLRARTGRTVDQQCLDPAIVNERRLLRMETQLIHRGIVEISWLAGDQTRAKDSAQNLLSIVRIWRNPWALGDAMTWALLVGIEVEPAENLPYPYARQLQGDASGAAQAWRDLGYVYEAGLALLLGDECDIRESIRIFEDLGAAATADRARNRLRGLGARSVPLGPRASTRANAAGLTEREAQILSLIAQGLSNAEIAQRLHRSVRTIEHHVTALIEKLSVDSRQRAVAVARERGLL